MRDSLIAFKTKMREYELLLETRSERNERRVISSKLAKLKGKRRLYLPNRGKCAYCGNQLLLLYNKEMKKKCMTLDHITPKILGGKDSFNNYNLSCLPCNQSKGSKPLEEWRVEN